MSLDIILRGQLSVAVTASLDEHISSALPRQLFGCYLYSVCYILQDFFSFFVLCEFHEAIQCDMNGIEVSVT